MEFSEKDLKQLADHGISVEDANEQLRRHATGFPALEVIAPAVAGTGITVLSPDQQRQAVERWDEYLADGGTVAKFVPASGAASRMFKALYEFVASGRQQAEAGSIPLELIDGRDRLPFTESWDDAVKQMYGPETSLSSLAAEGRHADMIRAIIDSRGMNYGNLPKGLLLFHSYPDGSRTPVEEHMTEGAQTAADANGHVALHFTVSPAHRKLFEEKIEAVREARQSATGRTFDVTMSCQSPSTDTIAANPDGTPFRREDGSLLFRPGGHGALIANLSDIDSEVVFVKNIDNVVPDSRRAATIEWKKILAGYLMELHDRIIDLVERLDADPFDQQTLTEAVRFMRRDLSTDDPRFDALTGLELADLLRCKLNRPLRVCGMVRNEGEPGGGPYVARNPDGSQSLQILESHQIDSSTPEGARLLAAGTHFNPVDLVCWLRDVDGEPFDLTQYTDPDTGFISSKSSEGKELKALELPGLWNGAMSDWNTAFVEVPAETFSPVKTVADLLRAAHQS